VLFLLIAVRLIVVMLSGIMLIVILLIEVKLIVALLSVIMLSTILAIAYRPFVIVLSVWAPVLFNVISSKTVSC